MLENNLNHALLELARLPLFNDNEIDEYLMLINEIVSEALSIERSSIWFFDELNNSIICHDLFDSKSRVHEKGIQLNASDYPNYFNAIEERRAITASDARIDPLTKEFAEGYLIPFNIHSLLDASIRSDGRVIGLLCCEKVGDRKDWSQSEQYFVDKITDVILRAHKAKERNKREIHSSKMTTLGYVAGSIGHEINNPLTVILGSLNMLQHMEECGETTPENRKRVLENIQATTWRIEKIVRGLRFFTQASDEHKCLVPVKQILENTLSLCAHSFKMKGVDLIFKGCENDFRYNCDSTRISQALLNLLHHSLESVKNFSKKWVQVEYSISERFFEIQIMDSRPNVHDKHHPLVDEIVKQHNGELFRDTEKPNSCIVLKFPLHN